MAKDKPRKKNVSAQADMSRARDDERAYVEGVGHAIRAGNRAKAAEFLKQANLAREAQGKPPLRREEVNVAGSSHIKRHKETRLKVENEHQDTFDKAVKESKTGPEATSAHTHPEGIPYEDFKKGQTPDQDKEKEPGPGEVKSSWKGERIRDEAPTGSGSQYTLEDRAAIEALQIYNSQLKSGKETERRQAAVNTAIARIGKQFPNEDINAGEVRRTAFGPQPARVSVTERRNATAKAKAGKKKTPVDIVNNVNEEATARWVKEHPRKGRTKYPGGATQGGGSGIPIPKQQKSKKEIRADKRKAGPAQLKPGQAVPKAKISNQAFLSSLSPEEANWVDEQMNEPKGIFYGAKGNKVPGAYRRWQKYVNARSVRDEDGKQKYLDRDNVVKWVTTDMRGRRNQDAAINPNRRYRDQSRRAIQSRYTGGIEKREGTKAKDRYKSLAPSHEDLGVGIKVPGLTKRADLKEKYPDASGREIFEMQQAEVQAAAEVLENQRMAHEQRQSRILGRQKSETAVDNQDRVVFLTTSTGFPAVSVGANSLIGQYIIQKRKRMLYDQRMASKAELKGEMPYAVRDQHVMEVATGLSIGAQGRYGAFKQLGYRVGAKKSKGYGKMLPVGSQVLRDSSGQPLYDRNGNLRYTEGFTRPFDVRPKSEVGMRIYLG